MKTIANITLIILMPFMIYMGVSQDLKTDNTKVVDNSVISPKAVLPISGSNISGDTCELVWTSSGKRIFYELMIANNINFKGAERIASRDTSYKKAIKNYKSGTLYWKVRAFKSKKSFSEWSAVSSFNIGTFATPVWQGCNGNCGNCPHPCGRRRAPINNENLIEIE